MKSPSPGNVDDAVVLYKLGGSLLDLPELSNRLTSLLERRRTARPLVVVGGGAAADLVREWDRKHSLGDEPAHRLALRAMQLNERLLAALLPRATVVSTREAAAAAWSESRLAIVSAFDFLAAEEATLRSESGTSAAATSWAGRPLPHTWDVTSDSIAAWIALRWPADEVVLLKSTAPPPKWRSEPGDFVDRHFREMAASLPHVDALNLRDEPFDDVRP